MQRSGVRSSCRPPPKSTQLIRRAASRTSMGSMRAFVVSAVALASIAVIGAQGTDPVALAAKVQQRYNNIKDIQADFVQTYEGGVLRTKTTDRKSTRLNSSH